MKDRIQCPNCKLQIRYCPGCKKLTTWHYDKAIGHGRCRECGGVDAKKTGKMRI